MSGDDECGLGRDRTEFGSARLTGVKPCEVRSWDDLETLVEWALCTTIPERRLVGTWDLDPDSDDPLAIGCERRVELEGRPATQAQ